MSEKRMDAGRVLKVLGAFVAVILLLGLHVSAAEGQQRQEVPFKRISVEEGLSQSTVQVIFQDRQGFLWIGTGDGLNRYDGYQFTVYKHDPSDPQSLSSNSITALYEGRDGTLWVGTYGGGLNRFDRRTGSFTHYPLEGAEAAGYTIATLYEDRDSTLWAGTDQGLVRLDRRAEALTTYTLGEEATGEAEPFAVRALYEDGDGALWVGTQRGLWRRDPETKQFSAFRHDASNPESLSSDRIAALYEDSSGVLWVGTYGGGLNRFDPETQTFEAFRPGAASDARAEGDMVGALCGDPSGDLWVGTAGGVYRFDPQTRAFTPYPLGAAQPGGHFGDRVLSVYADRAGVLWVGTAISGLQKLDRERETFLHYRHDPDRPNSLSNNTVWALHESRDGTLWIGTDGGGLDRLDRTTGAFTHYRHDPEDPNSLSGSVVMAIREDRAGRLWVGSNGGLDRFDRATGRVHRSSLTAESDSAHQAPESEHSAPSVFTIFEDQDGRLWIGSESGLHDFDPETGAVVTYRYDASDPKSLSSNHVRVIFEDSSGGLWVGTHGGGLNRLDRATGTFTRYRYDAQNANSLSNDIVLTIGEAPAGVLWIGTYGGGLSRLDVASGRFTRYTEQNSDLPTNTVMGVLGDAEGRLWMSTHRGLVSFDPQTATFRRYGVDRGVQSSEFNSGAYFSSRSGELFFGGINGFNAFHPADIRDNPHPPQVALTGISLFGRAAMANPHTILFDSSGEEELTLTHRENDLAFDYVGLHYSNPAGNRYAYQLEGYDADWHHVGPQRTASYTNLDPGRYIFRVRAANRDGVWNEAGASVALRILPPWWETWWAQLLGILLLALGIIAIDRERRQRLVRRERAQAEIREAQLQAEAAEARARALRAESERRARELEEARQLQLSMLPEALPQLPHAEIATYMKTATEVGGDYYDFDLSDDGTLTLAVGDATGHGLRASTMVTAVKSLFNLLAGEPDLVQALRQATRALRRMRLDKLYMALVLARLKGTTLELAGAGMPPALVWRAATGCTEAVPLKGMPLGGFARFPYEKRCVELAPGDTVVLMSDGFPEMFDGEGEMYGYDQARAAVEEAASLPPDEVVQQLADRVKTWSNGHALDDDVTFVVLKMKE